MLCRLLVLGQIMSSSAIIQSMEFTNIHRYLWYAKHPQTIGQKHKLLHCKDIRISINFSDRAVQHKRHASQKPGSIAKRLCCQEAHCRSSKRVVRVEYIQCEQNSLVWGAESGSRNRRIGTFTC